MVAAAAAFDDVVANATDADTTTTTLLQSQQPYVVELVDPPVVVKHGRDSHRHARHVVDYVQYLTAQQDAVVADFVQSQQRQRQLEQQGDNVQPRRIEEEQEEEGEEITIAARYHFVLNGVTLFLTPEQAEQLRQRDDVLYVWEETEQELLRTDGNNNNNNNNVSASASVPLTRHGDLWSKNALGVTGEDVVIGIIDSGIVPENPSFADDGSYGPPPTSFTGLGTCDFGNQKYNKDDQEFDCNNKLLAAKCYLRHWSKKWDDKKPCGGDASKLDANDYFVSARDDARSGHGSHVASTAAGNANVRAVMNDGRIEGIISGVAPRARLSVYKVCWNGGICASSDSLAALEDAVADGVDIINYSIGGKSRSVTDMAFLNVIQAGIVPVTSAGNVGREGPSTVYYPASYPWMVSVACADDQNGGLWGMQVSKPVQLKGSYDIRPPGSGGGVKTTPENMAVSAEDLVVAEPLEACDVPNNDLTGKVALVKRGGCLFTDKFNSVAAAGARAIIVYNDGAGFDRMGLLDMSIDDSTTIPGVFIEFQIGDSIRASLQSDEGDLVMSITTISSANNVKDFSSRGPNTYFSPNVLKPDIIAPGTNILAASTPLAAGDDDTGRSDFGYLSGTSMSSPGIAGFIALLKQAHPDWSPTALKSAMLTTARQGMTKQLLPEEPATPFDIGAGFPRIDRAMAPGLVYEIDTDDYKASFCLFDNRVIGQDTCNDLLDVSHIKDSSDLNYPSVSVANLKGRKTVTRTVTNVAEDQAAIRFQAVLDTEPGLEITVSPCEFILQFRESISFEVTVEASPGSTNTNGWLFGSLTWVGEVADPLAELPQNDETSVCTTASASPIVGPPPVRYLRARSRDSHSPFSKFTTFTSVVPSAIPASNPSMSPTGVPSSLPSATRTTSTAPSDVSKSSPSLEPTESPTILWSSSPTTSTAPSAAPISSLSQESTGTPTPFPTLAPAASTIPSAAPIQSPSLEPTGTPTPFPTLEPTTSTIPSTAPTFSPLPPTGGPTNLQSSMPTIRTVPSSSPSLAPSNSSPPSSTVDKETVEASPGTTASQLYSIRSDIVVSF